MWWIAIGCMTLFFIMNYCILVTMSTADAALIQAAQANPEYFAALYEKYAEPLYRFIFFRVGQDAAAAEDLTAEVFVKALRDLPNYEDRGYPYSTYLYRLARNICIDHYRTQQHQPHELEVATDVTAAHDPALQTDIQLLWQKLRSYDPITIEVFTLRYLDGLSFDEISQMVGKSSGALRTLVSRTISQLQKEYD